MHCPRQPNSVLVFLILLAVLLSGCSSSLTSPEIDQLKVQQPQTSNNRVLWGVWDIVISTEDGIVEAVPDRTSAFSCNVVKFLQPPSVPVHMLVTELDLAASDIPNGYIEIDVTINHPFPGTVLCGHDVYGIILDNFNTTQLVSDPDITLSMPPDSLLLNPDGYTRWWNQLEFTSYDTIFGYTQGEKAKGDYECDKTLNPFIYYSDDTPETGHYNPDPLSRGFFSSLDPGINTRRFILQFQTDGGNPKWEFKYAVSASYAGPNDGAEPPYTASDFPVSANQPEAYWLGFVDTESTAFYENDTTYGGDLDFYIEVRDWQFSGDISTVAEELSGLVIESPTLFDTPVDLDISLAEPVIGNPTAFRIPGHVENVTPSGLTHQHLIITAICADPVSYEPQIPGLTGFAYPDGPLAAYGIVQVPILSESPNIPPVADASDSSPLSGYAPLSVTLDPSASYDPDGTIVKYEWDYQNDGTWDTSNTSPDSIIHEFAEGTHYVNLRVTDNWGAMDTLDIPLEIIVDPAGLECEGPDESEPNPTCETADPMLINTSVYGCVQETWDQRDNWEFTLPADGMVDIHLYNDGAGDVDFGYTDADCEWLGGSGTHLAGQDEWVYDISLFAGTYTIHVTADNDSGPYEPERHYHLEVTFTPDQIMDQVICYTAYVDEQWGVWQMDENGGSQEFICSTTSRGLTAWSPDGSQIAFTVEDSGSDIYVVNVDGSDKHPVTSNQAASFPYWENNNQIIYSWGTGAEREIHRINSDGSGDTLLTTVGDNASDGQPFLSPGGSQVVFTRGIPYDGSSGKIYIADYPSFEDAVLIADVGGIEWVDIHPCWSVDDKIIFTNRPSSEEAFLYTVNTDGSGLAMITPDETAYQVLAKFSPDTNKIVLNERLDGVDTVWKMNSDGTGRIQLVDEQSFGPDWRRSLRPIGRGKIHGNHCLQVDSNGNPNVFFARAPGEQLGYASWNGVDWDHMNGNIGVFRAEGLDLADDDTPHVIYGTPSFASLDYATYNGTGWDNTGIYTTTWPGTDSSIALDSLNLPHLGIHGGGSGGQGVWHYWYDTSWNSEHPIAGDQLISPHIEMDSEDYPHIMTHYMYGSSHLWHIYEDSDGWHTDNLGVSGNQPHSEFDSNGVLHCAYATGAGGDADNNIGYFFWNGSTWSTPVTVDSSADLRYVSLAIDSNDLPHISYIDIDAKELIYATYEDDEWTTTTVVDSVDVVGRTSIAVLPDDTPVIAYNDDTNGSVECVWVE